MQPNSILSQVAFSLQLKTGFYTLSLINPQIFNKSVHQGAFDSKANINAFKTFLELWCRKILSKTLVFSE